MCRHVKLLTPDEVKALAQTVREDLRQERIAGWDDALAARVDAYPTAVLPAYCATRDALFLTSFTWGYPVEWQKGVVFNTRIESALAGRGLWDESLRTRRCAIPVAGFFESQRATGRQCLLSTGAPAFLAGIYEGGHCSVMTTEPNRFVAPIHRRMPLVLASDEVGVWLEGDYASLSDRSGVVLSVVPEDAPTQGSLF